MFRQLSYPWMLMTIFFVFAASCSDDTAHLKKTCEAEDADACFELGTIELASGSRNRARKLLRRGCELDQVDACALAGGVDYARYGRDSESQFYLTKACRLGDKESCVNAAWMLYNGEGDGPDRKGAIERLGKICEENFKEGCLVLGLLKQLEGFDEPTWRLDLKKACKLGSSIACGVVEK